MNYFCNGVELKTRKRTQMLQKMLNMKMYSKVGEKSE